MPSFNRLGQVTPEVKLIRTVLPDLASKVAAILNHENPQLLFLSRVLGYLRLSAGFILLRHRLGHVLAGKELSLYLSQDATMSPNCNLQVYE